MTKLRQIAAAAALTTTAALAASAPSAHAAVPCFKTFSAPGSGWKVQNDGSLMQSLQSNGSAMDEDHGHLTVAGAAYPKLAGDQCGQSATTMTFPTRNLGGFSVSRAISETGGKLRWLDTIKNNGAAQVVQVQFGLEVLPSQRIQTTESGNNTADEHDHWSVHKSQSLFSLHQWGQDGAIAQPTVISEDGGDHWEEDFGQMDDDATLHYAFFIGAQQTVRLLHGGGTAPSLESAVSSAQSAGGLFTGYSRAVADDVVNFSDDPDGDGVSKFLDDCPAVPAEGANGCPKLIIPVPPADPVDPQDPNAQPGEQPQPAPEAPAQGGTTPGATTADTTPPAVAITGVGGKLRRSTLTGRRGAKAAVSCTEACSVRVKVVVKPRGKRERTVQTITRTGFSEQSRTIRLKVKRTALQRLAKQRVTLVVEATDRAGNRTSQRRTIGLR